MSLLCCYRALVFPILSLYTLVTLSVVLITMAVIHLHLEMPPTKRRRTLTGAVISTAVSAAVIGTGQWSIPPLLLSALLMSSEQPLV